MKVGKSRNVKVLRMPSAGWHRFSDPAWISSKTTNSLHRDNLSTILVWVAHISSYLCISTKGWTHIHKCKLQFLSRKSLPKCHSAVCLCDDRIGRPRSRKHISLLLIFVQELTCNSHALQLNFNPTIGQTNPPYSLLPGHFPLLCKFIVRTRHQAESR